MVDTTKAVERKKKKAEAKKKALKAAQEGKEKEDKAYRDKEFGDLVTPQVKMDDGTTKDVKYLNRDEGRALVKELCEHKTEFCLMGAVEMTKDYILPAFWKKDAKWPKRAIYKRKCKK